MVVIKCISILWAMIRVPVIYHHFMHYNINTHYIYIYDNINIISMI